MKDSYTAEELIRQAQSIDPAVNRKLFERYITKGLVARGRHVGRGPGGGRGARWLWPYRQLQLWLTLVGKRRQTTDVRALANVPVFIWLYWGDGYVGLEQVKLALETYAELPTRNAGKVPRHDYRGAARKYVRELAGPSGGNPRARQALVDFLAEAGAREVADWSEADRLLTKVVGPGDRRAQFDGPRAVFALKAHWAAITHLQGLGTAYLRWARAFYLYGLASYGSARPGLAEDARFGALHQPYDLSDRANSACKDLLFILGMALVRPADKGLPEALQLDPWLEGRAELAAVTQIETQPFMPGRGQQLHVEVAINLKPAT